MGEADNQNLESESEVGLGLENKNQVWWRVGMIAVVVVLLAVIGGISLKYYKLPQNRTVASPKPELVRFRSDEEFRNLLVSSAQYVDYPASGFAALPENADSVAIDLRPMGPNAAVGKSTLPENSGRYSSTNVQVKGIDEPDIVKTDGKHIYFSANRYFLRPVPLETQVESQNARSESMPYDPGYQKEGVLNIRAMPVSDVGVVGRIENYGQLLLDGDNLVVIGNDKLYGYDVSDPASPKSRWTSGFKNGTNLVAARLFKGRLYTVVNTSFDRRAPCPIVPFEGTGLKIACTDIYRPVSDSDANSTFTIAVLNIRDGSVERSVSFVGRMGSSVVYMSADSIFVSYRMTGNRIGFLYDFFAQKAGDLVSTDFVRRLQDLKGLPISERARMVEFEVAMQEEVSSKSSDDQLKFMNEMSDRMAEYSKQRVRELDKSGLARIDVNSLKVVANGSVPGQPLNQYSLDEYKGNLRIATTVSFSEFGPSESVNDVYVLNSELDQLGSVTDLGLGERIYSARFMGERGYVVTFRQTDPFYVLDLSDPRKPVKKGELKIPGYSAYLHPIRENVVLGVGKENNQVKLALFDVTSASLPVETDKYLLDDYWSDILNTSTAFLQDEKHKVVFVPGGKGGYVFSYEGDQLRLVKAISGIQTKRAVFIKDYMYVISEEKMVVVNESDWETVRELVF